MKEETQTTNPEVRMEEALRKMYKNGKTLGLSHIKHKGYNIDRACRNAAKFYNWAAAKYLEGYMSVAKKVTADDFRVASECIGACKR